MPRIVVLDDNEIDLLKKFPLEVLICFILPIQSTFLLSYFDLACWSIAYHGAIAISLIILGYIIPILFFIVFLFSSLVFKSTKEK